MEVIRAKVLGYCMGVKRAVDCAVKALEENKNKSTKVYTLGPLIHNPSVLNELKEKGLEVLDSNNICNVQADSVVIIRAHGTTPEVMNKLKSCGCTVIDATCPRVHLSQKRASEWKNKGYSIIIAGDKNHGEVTSISGYADNKVTVIENIQQALELQVNEKSVLIAQTTFSPVIFEKIVEILKEKNKDIVVFNSICSATMERQDALLELKDKAEGIIVIGGKNSANTRRLYETAGKICSKTALIENESEIPSDFYNLKSIAITAGASTPDEIIDKVENYLKTTSLK